MIKFDWLYLLLREQFAHPDDPWCSETLKWWNNRVFGGTTSSDGEDDAEANEDNQGIPMRKRIENERRGRMIQARAST